MKLCCNTSLYCCTLPGRAIWQTERTNQHKYPQGVRRNHCTRSVEYPIISGDNYSTGPSPSAQFNLQGCFFLTLKTKSMQSSQVLNLQEFKKEAFLCPCVLLHTLHCIRFSQSCCTLDGPYHKGAPSFTQLC